MLVLSRVVQLKSLPHHKLDDEIWCIYFSDTHGINSFMFDLCEPSKAAHHSWYAVNTKEQHQRLLDGFTIVIIYREEAEK